MLPEPQNGTRVNRLSKQLNLIFDAITITSVAQKTSTFREILSFSIFNISAVVIGISNVVVVRVFHKKSECLVITVSIVSQGVVSHNSIVIRGVVGVGQLW